MFDWIGDAVSWIGDGISSLWDNTVGEVTDAIGDWIWECMFEWLFNLIFGAVAELFEFINESAADIFDMAWAGAFLSLFHHLAWMLFICGMVVAITTPMIPVKCNPYSGISATDSISEPPRKLHCVQMYRSGKEVPQSPSI